METMEKDRVRENTSTKTNTETDCKTRANIEKYSRNTQSIDKRIEKLEKEWDIERVLELNASVISLFGVAMSVRNKFWLVLPGLVTSFLVQHATQGWCPPLNLFRKLGFRTRQEIDREKYALKALRGDFEHAWDVEDAWLSSK